MRYTFDEAGSVIGFSTHYPNFTNGYWENYLFAKSLQDNVIAVYRSDYTEAKGYYPTLVASYEYDPWGKVTKVKGSAGTVLSLEAYPNHIAHVNPIRYRGYYYDTETGFYYLQSRYYDPVISRFINADSYGSTGQGFLGTNMFAYCYNNPVNLTDPSGCVAITVPTTAPGWGAILEALATVGVYVNPVISILTLGLLSVRSGGKSPIKTASASVSSSSAVSEKIDWEGGDNIHHVLEGTHGRHIEGWNKMGIDPTKEENWGILLPLLKYVVDNYDSVEKVVTAKGVNLVYYYKEFTQFGITVVVKIWVSADGLIQQLSDAWPIIN